MSASTLRMAQQQLQDVADVFGIDDDLDAGRGRRPGLVEGERADLVDEAGGQRRRRLFRVGWKRRDEQAADDEQAPRQAARRDARERSEQGDRQHGATVEGRAVGHGGEQAGKGRAIRAYVRRTSF